MNKNAFYLAIFAVLCVLAGVVAGAGMLRMFVAAPGGFPGGKPCFMGGEMRGPGMGREGGDPLERLVRRLGLNEEQRKKIDAIVEQTRAEMDGAEDDFHSAMMSVREKSNEQIMRVLTPEQQEKFKILLAEHDKKRCPGPGAMMGAGARPGMEPENGRPDADGMPEGMEE